MAVEMEETPAVAAPRTPTLWNPGQHLAVIGQTGQGKSTVIEWLLKQRQYVLILKSKPDDIEYEGTRLVKTVGSLRSQRHWRWVLEPTYSNQATEFEKAYDLVWREGGWTLDIDELFYHDTQLKLREPINRLFTQGRSKGISVVCGMQRPASVTRFAVGESTHVLSFQLEGRDASIFRDATSSRAAEAVQSLQRHEFVWYRRPNFLTICKLNLSTGQLDTRNVSRET